VQQRLCELPHPSRPAPATPSGELPYLRAQVRRSACERRRPGRTQPRVCDSAERTSRPRLLPRKNCGSLRWIVGRALGTLPEEWPES